MCYDRRVPIAQSPDAATLITRRALYSQHLDLNKWDDSKGKIAWADDWIEKAPPRDENQILNFRLLLTKWNEGRELIEQLLAEQNPDGGWNQLKGLPSDAYATGQTLYALLSKDPLLTVDPSKEDVPALEKRVHCPVGKLAEIEKAVKFLADTQKEDGSWPAISYVHGVGQPGAHNMRPDTNAACAWAVIGLAAVR